MEKAGGKYKWLILEQKQEQSDLLGRNQIADLPTAITELWKNGYDAYGDYLDAGLYCVGYKDVKYDIFTISDDGFGMNESDILNVTDLMSCPKSAHMNCRQIQVSNKGLQKTRECVSASLSTSETVLREQPKGSVPKFV